MRKEIVPDPGQPVLLDTRDVALILRRSEHQIRRDVHKGTVIPPFVVGGSRRWDRDELAAWISARCPRAEVWARRPGQTDRPIETTGPRDEPKVVSASLPAELSTAPGAGTSPATQQKQVPVPPAATTTDWGLDEIRAWIQQGCPPRQRPAANQAQPSVSKGS